MYNIINPNIVKYPNINTTIIKFVLSLLLPSLLSILSLVSLYNNKKNKTNFLKSILVITTAYNKARNKINIEKITDIIMENIRPRERTRRNNEKMDIERMFEEELKVRRKKPIKIGKSMAQLKANVNDGFKKYSLLSDIKLSIIPFFGNIPKNNNNFHLTYLYRLTKGKIPPLKTGNKRRG
jgi:hypothetical protein